jgi:hypothetical protein
MVDGPPYSVVRAARKLGQDRRLVGYLLREYGIPTRRGPQNARLLTAEAFEQLQDALAEFEGKPDPDLLASA